MDYLSTFQLTCGCSTKTGGSGGGGGGVWVRKCGRAQENICHTVQVSWPGAAWENLIPPPLAAGANPLFPPQSLHWKIHEASHHIMFLRGRVFKICPAQSQPVIASHKFTGRLTGEAALCQELLCGPVQQEDPEGVFLAGVQSCHRSAASGGGQHQFWLGHRCKRKAKLKMKTGRTWTVRLVTPPSVSRFHGRQTVSHLRALSHGPCNLEQALQLPSI